MRYLFYKCRNDAARELVLQEGADFPRHVNERDWYLHATHGAVNERMEIDIITLGYSERDAAATFGQRVPPRVHVNIMRRPSPF